MVMESATKIMKLKQARDGQTNIPTSVVFTKEEEGYIERLLPNLEGKTEKLKNPYPKGNLARATWVIARLGGWKGYASSRPAGSKTLKRGLDKFNDFAWAWNFQNERKDVCEP